MHQIVPFKYIQVIRCSLKRGKNTGRRHGYWIAEAYAISQRADKISHKKPQDSKTNMILSIPRLCLMPGCPKKVTSLWLTVHVGDLLWNNLLGAQLSKKKDSWLSKLQFKKAKRTTLSGQLLSCALPSDQSLGPGGRRDRTGPVWDITHSEVSSWLSFPQRPRPNHNHKRKLS